MQTKNYRTYSFKFVKEVTKKFNEKVKDSKDFSKVIELFDKDKGNNKQ